MNLWVFNHYAVTPSMAGGTRHYDFGRELVKRGYKVAIFASSFHYSQHKELKLSKKEKYKVENIGGINFVWIKTFPYQKNDWRRVLNMLGFMIRSYWIGGGLPKTNSSIDKPDLVIGSSVHLLAVLSAYYVAHHYKARFIMEVRDLWPQTIVDMGEMSEHNPIIKLLQVLEKFLYKRAKRIITLLPLAGEYISAYGIGKEKVLWIPNGVSLTRFASGDAPRLEPESKFKVMYLGAHGQANALNVLLEAAKVIQDSGYKDVRFILVGDGPEKPKLMAQKEGSRLENVEFHDPVPKHQVPKVLHKADVTIFIVKDMELHKYGISLNKVFDYMASSKPVIMAGNPINDIVKEANCGLTVPPQNPEALAEAIIKLYYMEPEERKAMGKRGREYVEEYHSIPILVNNLLKVLESIEDEREEGAHLEHYK